ncbi:hypothetical protein ABI59_04460 [Acidobacteria bacterium Mor1]|nr:hypothetical protein ABI59_04460 [Acidobacteria bacterium Mor1]
MVAMLLLVASCSNPSSLSEEEHFRLVWQGNRQVYCNDQRGQRGDDLPFDRSGWRSGNALVRGTMLTDLICGGRAYGLTRAGVIELLGPSDYVDTLVLWKDVGDPLMYRVELSKPYRYVPPPPPPGCSTIPDLYDVRIVFDLAEDKVIGLDPLSAVECPGPLPSKMRRLNP